MAATVTVLVTLEDMGACISCGTRFAAESAFKQQRVRDRKEFYCPNGHAQIFCDEPVEARLRRELEEQKLRTQRADQLAQQRGEANAKLYRTNRQLAGKVRAIKKRVANGVCPCCHRSFVQLQRHMATKHPAWVEEQEKSAAEMERGA